MAGSLHHSLHLATKYCIRIGGDLVPGTPHIALSQRIHRFVGVFERYKRRPDPREARHVLCAIECLREGSYEDGERAIGAAEQVFTLAEFKCGARGKTKSERTSKGPAPVDDVSTHDLRAALRSVIRARASGPPSSGSLEVATCRAR